MRPPVLNAGAVGLANTMGTTPTGYWRSHAGSNPATRIHERQREFAENLRPHGESPVQLTV